MLQVQAAGTHSGRMSQLDVEDPDMDSDLRGHGTSFPVLSPFRSRLSAASHIAPPSFSSHLLHRSVASLLVFNDQFRSSFYHLARLISACRSCIVPTHLCINFVIMETKKKMERHRLRQLLHVHSICISSLHVHVS